MKDYKKILECVVNIINTTEKSDIGFANICTYIGENCPELKESEDERIRKKLIDFLWKEKIFLQEAHSSVENNPKYRFVMDAISWLEKQCEQKPANKVEPKFKVGEWIVWNNKNYKVNYNGCGYELIDQNGLSTSLEYGTVDESAHLWDITKDAKDGDVLVDRDSYILIYQEPSTTTHYHSYCYYHIQSDSFIAAGGSHEIKCTKPATKEQRDLLFSVMKEKGYELDSEKKELKKIHNVLEDCEIENIEHGKYYYCIKDYYSGGNKRASKGDVVLALRGMSMMALGVKANEYFIPVNAIKQEKSNWSIEDDKNHIDSLLKRLTGLCRNEFERTRFAISEDQDWLESLKERLS